MKNYQVYSEDDFIMDSDFQSWAKYPTPESEAFWNNFLKTNPHKRHEVESARTMLKVIEFKENLLPTEKEAMWNEVASAMQKEKSGRIVVMKKTGKISTKLRYFAAAVLAGFVILPGLYLVLQKPPAKLIATNFGEIREVKLPDSSLVTLNAQSNLKYDTHWDNKNEREVWIDGEAFFSIKPTADYRKFIVHTEEADIEVLGTEFNVMHREARLKVSLNSGNIRLKVHNSPDTVYMKPGEILEFASNNIIKTSGKVDQLSVWKDQKLVFDDTPVSEIMRQLRYIYGWDYANIGQDILDERLTGELDIRDEQKLINTLEKALRIRIDKEGNIIRISRI